MDLKKLREYVAMKLDLANRGLKEDMSKFKDYAKQSYTYALEWNALSLVRREHEVKWYRILEKSLTNEKNFTETLKSLEDQLLRYYPPRSTSLISNDIANEQHSVISSIYLELKRNIQYIN